MSSGVRHAVQMQGDVDNDGAVTLSMSRAELIGLREAIAFADFLGDLPARSDAEVKVLGDFIRMADPLVPGLGTDDYEKTVNAAWREIAAG